MKNKKSFFVALGLIVVPIVIYWLLSLGTHTFTTLPIYGERIAPEGDQKDTIYYKVPDFRLVSQFGDTVTQETIGKRIYIANFFFARCKDVCPKMNAKVETIYTKCQELAQTKPEYKNILFISHTVDPDKRIRGIYDGLEDRDIKRLREDIDVLIHEYNNKQTSN